MEIIRERINPEWDSENYEVSFIEKKVKVLSYYILLDEKTQDKIWRINAIEEDTGEKVSYTLNMLNISKRIQRNLTKHMRWEKGASYVFVWKVCVRKHITFPTNTGRYAYGPTITLFDGHRRINGIRSYFSDERGFGEENLDDL